MSGGGGGSVYPAGLKRCSNLARNAQALVSWELDSDLGLALKDLGRSLASAQRAIELGGDSTQNWPPHGACGQAQWLLDRYLT
jgi:hypothetical protein